MDGQKNDNYQEGLRGDRFTQLEQERLQPLRQKAPARAGFNAPNGCPSVMLAAP